MKVLLVDDEPLAIERLRVLFADIDDVAIVGQASDGDGALAAIRQLEPDLVILDVQMPGRNGLWTAAQLDMAARPEIVFITAHEHFAPDAFDLEAADYILKPVRFDRLRQATERARRRRRLQSEAARAGQLEDELQLLRTGQTPPPSPDPEIWVPERHGQRRVPIESIDWIEAARDYVLLHTELRSFMLRITMAALEEKLEGSRLIRVHRSAFVRPDKVAEVRRQQRATTLVLADDTVVQVGPSYLASVEAALGLRPGTP